MNKKLKDILTVHGIPINNVVCCVTDNEPVNNCAANTMPFPWMGCFTHLLELVARVPFKRGEMSKTLIKAREIVGFFRHSSQAQEKLINLQKAMSDSAAVILEQDVQTRWWSTLNSGNASSILRKNESIR